MTLIERSQKFAILILAEARRDTQSWPSFASKYVWIAFSCLIYSFFLKAALWRHTIPLNGQEMDFALFLISGFAFLRLVPFSLRIFDETLAGLKQAHLLDWLRTSRTSFWELTAARAAWNIFRAMTEFTALVFFARLLIGTPLKLFFQAAAIAPAFWMFTAYTGMGFAVSALALFLSRNANLPFTLITQLSTAFGGVFYPVAWISKLKLLHFISLGLPITYALESMRTSFLPKGASVPANLILWAAVSLAAGSFLLNLSIKQANRNGRF